MRLWKGTATIAGSQAVGTVLGMAFGIVVSRTLGPAGKGMFALVATVLQIAQVAGNLGFYRSNLYYAGHRPADRARLAANSLLIAGLAGTGTAVLFYYLLTATGPGRGILGEVPVALLGAALLVTPSYFYIQYAQGILLGMGQLFLSQVIDVAVRFCLLVGSLVVTVGLHLGIFGVVWQWVSLLSIEAVVYAVAVYRCVGPSPLPFDGALFRSMVMYSIRTYGATLLAFVLSRMDFLYVHGTLGESQAGIYSVAMQAVDVLSYVPLAVSAQLIPHIARESEDAGLTCRATRMLILVMLVLVAVIALGAWPGLLILYGRAFVPGAPAMLAILPGALVLSVQTLLAGDLAGRGYPSFLVWVWVPALLLEGAALPLAVPRWGLTGAAMVTSTAYLLTCVLTIGYFLRYHPRVRLRELFPTAEDVRSLLARQGTRSGRPTPAA